MEQIKLLKHKVIYAELTSQEDKQQSRLNRFQAKLDEHGKQLNELRAQRNKQQKRCDKQKAKLEKLHAKCDACCKKLWDIRENIIKVRMELYSNQTEDINRVWNLCDELRKLIYNEEIQCTKLNKYECKYYECDAINDKCYDEIDHIRCLINSCVFDVDDLIEYVSEYAPKLVKTLIKYKSKSKYNFNLAK